MPKKFNVSTLSLQINYDIRSTKSVLAFQQASKDFFAVWSLVGLCPAIYDEHKVRNNRMLVSAIFNGVFKQTIINLYRYLRLACPEDLQEFPVASLRWQLHIPPNKGSSDKIVILLLQ